MLAPTCFGSSLPSYGSFIDPSELLEIQIKRVKGKGKGRFSGFILHCDFVKPIVPSPLGLPSFTNRDAVYQSDTQRTLLAEEGTNGI
jgi:hypothetical protein